MEAPQYFDIHTHVNFTAFDADRDATIKRALDAGVYMINVGTQKDTSAKAVEMANKYEQGVYAAVAIHPVHTGKSYHDEKELGEGGKAFTSRGEVFDAEYYRKLASDKKVVAIGECGLDYYHMEHGAWNMEQTEKQKEIFRKHIELAIEVNKPLMLHVRSGGGRSAYLDALAILKEYPKAKGDFHFFAGSLEEARAILDAGFYLSFTGVITFARDYDEVIKKAPLERIMAETDAPYVAPAPFRGKRNEPIHVREVVKAIAGIRGEPVGQVREQLFKNAQKLFGISPIFEP